MRRTSREIRVRSGQFEFVKLNTKKSDLRDTYHWILRLSWPGFAGFIFGIYLLINVAFAMLYLMDPHGVAEMAPGSSLDAFFFSVETLATVGYGHMYPAGTSGLWRPSLGLTRSLLLQSKATRITTTIRSNGIGVLSKSTIEIGKTNGRSITEELMKRKKSVLCQG